MWSIIIIISSSSPPPSSSSGFQFGDTDSQVWSSVKSEACRSLLANEQHVFLNSTVYTKNIRGNVQAYFKTSPDAAWTPMGPAYRHMVTCTKKSSARVER